jgi:hypothetical protein
MEVLENNQMPTCLKTALGAGGREFESRRPDQNFIDSKRVG